MQNITYEISENKKYKEQEAFDIDRLVAEITSSNGNESKGNGIDDNLYAIQVNYSSNYSVKQLALILDYYEIPKRKLRKEEMVQLIVLYENEPCNMKMVEQRKRLWEYVSELKKDKFLSKFLMIEL